MGLSRNGMAYTQEAIEAIIKCRHSLLLEQFRCVMGTDLEIMKRYIFGRLAELESLAALFGMPPGKLESAALAELNKKQDQCAGDEAGQAEGE